MVHRDEILKPIWHAFSALDVDRKGKVSKSQLKVRGEKKKEKRLACTDTFFFYKQLVSLSWSEAGLEMLSDF